MQRWNRKRSHFPLVAFVLLIVILCSILYNESSIQQIHEDPDHHVPHHQETTITYIKPNLVSYSKHAPGMFIYHSGDFGFLSLLCISLFLLPNLFHFFKFMYNFFKFVVLRYNCLFVLVAVWGILGGLDRFSRCNSTREYSGKKIRWVDPKPEPGRRRESLEACDVFSGKWVFDNKSYPLYNESDCPYMSDQLACHKHGRSDLGYQYWRWQPNNCNLKRYSFFFLKQKLFF